jgi:hypothetical protein
MVTNTDRLPDSPQQNGSSKVVHFCFFLSYITIYCMLIYNIYLKVFIKKKLNQEVCCFASLLIRQRWHLPPR